MDIMDSIFSFIPSTRKVTPSGWVKFNSVCCVHRGQTADTRERSGIKRTADQVSVHCFNCGFTASFRQGNVLGKKMRAWLEYAGADERDISALVLFSMRNKVEHTEIKDIITLPTFKETSLPDGSVSLIDAALTDSRAFKCLEYLIGRGMDIDDCEWMWTPKTPNRVIIPFKHYGKIVGSISRRIDSGPSKYIKDIQPGFIFNVDSQLYQNKYCIVTEGVLDALCLSGMAVLSAEISPVQALQVNRLGKQVIYVPDRDSAGKANIATAIAHGWAVSMPSWGDGIKDINDACKKYGRLLTLRSVIDSAEYSKFKIQLREKLWFRPRG